MNQQEERLQQVMGIARTILHLNPDDLDALLNEFSRMDALMPILDPTGYKQVMGNIPDYREVVGAIAGARRKIASVLPLEIDAAFANS